MVNFLQVPLKRSQPLPALAQKLRSYISEHFRDTHPDALKWDIEQLVGMRKEWVEPAGEIHREFINGLLRYHAQLVFLSTKFPSDIGVAFAWHLPFLPPFSITPDSAIALPSILFERAAVLYNIGAIYATMAASENRSEGEGIKRALAYLQTAAGTFEHLLKEVLPLLTAEISTLGGAGYDMTEPFVQTMRDFVLAEAQECFWQKAVLEGYKNAIVGKLSQKVSDYYDAALTSANSTTFKALGYLPTNWVAHITVKKLHFEAAAQYRFSQDDLEKGRYGEEIARLKLAEGLTKKALESARRGVADAVTSDVKSLAGTLSSSLERAIRDNDLVYVCPVPPVTQLAPITGAGMVKASVPVEIADAVSWLMKDSKGGPLFSGLVPYGVHLAISVYDDRKDTNVREVDNTREDLDGIAASTLQSLNLPSSISALERPIGLPPSLLRKAEEIESTGGTDRVQSLLDEVARLARSNATVLSEALDILDQEATENETLLETHPQLAQTRQPSHEANRHLTEMATRYEHTLKQAAASDESVRTKWDEWEAAIEILGGGEDTLNENIPTTTASNAEMPASVRPLRQSLEALDDLISHRARLVAEVRRMAEADDIRPLVIQEASKLAHGGSGDVKPEWFEEIFERELVKYQRLKLEMQGEAAKQEKLLDIIKTQNDAFLNERKDDPRIKARESKLQEMELAYWKWREVVGNAEEGIKFYHDFANLLARLKETCKEWVYSRRIDVGQMTQQFERASMAASPPPAASHYAPVQGYSPAPTPYSPAQATYTPAPAPAVFSPPAPYSPPAPVRGPPSFKPSFSLSHPSSTQWQTEADFLPPPPPAPVLRSTAPRQAPPPPSPAPATPSKRVTRSSGRADIGDAARNPYQKGTRKEGGGVV